MALIAVSRSALSLSTVMHDGVVTRWRRSLAVVAQWADKIDRRGVVMVWESPIGTRA